MSPPRRPIPPRWRRRGCRRRPNLRPIISSCAPRINWKSCWTIPSSPKRSRCKITQSRYKFGVAARADVVTAETQLLSSQAQQVNAKIQRAILEHAVAVLIGKQPAEFSLAASAMRSATCRRCPPACPPPCWNAGRTWRKRNAKWRRPMRKLASPRPDISRT